MLDRLLDNVRYVPGTFDDDSMYERLKECLAEFDEAAGIVFNRAFYLSTAPTFFPVIVGKLGEHGLNERGRGRGARGDREADRQEPRRGA